MVTDAPHPTPAPSLDEVARAIEGLQEGVDYLAGHLMHQPANRVTLGIRMVERLAAALIAERTRAETAEREVERLQKDNNKLYWWWTSAVEQNKAALARTAEVEAALADERRHHARTFADLKEVQDGECCDGYEGQIALLQAVARDQSARADQAEGRATRYRRALEWIEGQEPATADMTLAHTLAWHAREALTDPYPTDTPQPEQQKDRNDDPV